MAFAVGAVGMFVDALVLAVELPDADELFERAIAAVRSTDELLPGVFDTLDVDPWLPAAD